MGPILNLLNESNIRYLVIGGQAMRLEGMPRFSMDWDVFIPRKDLGNIARINEVLGEYLDMKLEPMGPKGQGFVQTFQTPYGILQFHLAPLGLASFDEAETRQQICQSEDGISVKCVGIRDLLKAKEAAGRDQDLEDAEFLRIKLDSPNR